MAAFLLRAALPDPDAERLAFAAVKTMYGGKAVARDDTVYVVAAESGPGLLVRGRVVAASALPPPPGPARWTPRVDLALGGVAPPRRPLTAAEIRRFVREAPAHPAAELIFKFYRQATPKLGGVSPEAAAFLDGYFEGG